MLIVIRPETNTKFNVMLNTLTKWLTKRHVDVSFLAQDEQRISKILSDKNLNFIDKKKLKGIDFILSLGGDGTLIGFCRDLNYKIPIIGVNWGKLGFITEFSSVEMYDALESILKNKFKTITRSFSKVTIIRGAKKIFQSQFINDAVISNGQIARMFSLNIECGDEIVFNISGDGVIVSTPLGSTAYSLAAGGPIVHPEVKSLILTPICPHGLTYRPMVISENTPIKILVHRTDGIIYLTVDGQVYQQLEKGDSVIIEKEARRKLYFVQNPDRSYFQTLKEKFMLNKRGV